MAMQKIILIVFITLSFYIVCNGGRLGSRTLVPICLVLFRRNHGEPSKKHLNNQSFVMNIAPDGLGYMQDCNADRVKKGA